MKKYDFLKICNTYVIPSLEIALGVILVVNPDTGSALVSRLAGWLLIVTACTSGAGALSSTGQQRSAQFLCAAAFLAGGIWLLTHPLMLAGLLGRVLAFALLYWGGVPLWNTYRIRRSGGNAQWPVSSCLIAGLGAVLLVSPMSLSRLLFRVVGLVVAALGISELLRRLKGTPCLEEGDDPNIIDAL